MRILYMRILGGQQVEPQRSGELWGRSGELWACFEDALESSGDALWTSGDALGSSGEALGKLWGSSGKLWKRFGDDLGNTGDKETKREQPRRDTESILIHQKICPPKLPITRLWRPYWYYNVILFNRFAHSAGPGMVRHRVVLIGIGMDDLMRSSKGQEGTGR